MKRKSLITLILGTALAVAPAAHAVVLSDGGGSNTVSVAAPSTGMSAAEYRASFLRGEALNRQYGAVASTTVRPQVTDGWTNSISPSSTLRPDILGGDGGESTGPVVTGGNSFAWDRVGIGAATLIGLMLLGLASLAATRRRQQPSF